MDLDCINIIPNEISQTKSNTRVIQALHMDFALGGLFYVQPYLSTGYLLFHREWRGEECNQWCVSWLLLWGKKKNKTEKAKACKNWFFTVLLFLLYKYSGHQQGITEPRWHTKKCMRLASETSPPHPCMQPSDHRLPPWDPEIPKGTSFKKTASSAATPHRVCQFSLTQKGDLSCCRWRKDLKSMC